MPTSRAAAIAASTITSADVAAPENRLAEAINSIPNSASLWKLSDTLPQARKQDESSHNSNLALLGKKPSKRHCTSLLVPSPENQVINKTPRGAVSNVRKPRI